MMKKVIIIPARYASTRFPAKPLFKFKGPEGHYSLIEHSWRAANKVSNIDDIFVATDHEKIANTVERFGGKVLMTSDSCINGTERCSEALEMLGSDVEMVINFQGDAPLTPPEFVESLIKELDKSPKFTVATPVIKTNHEAKLRLLTDRKNDRVGATTVVFDSKKRALYFSKEVIPFGKGDVYHHVGVYAYRPSALTKYNNLNQSFLEKSEGLEQLRFLENKTDILCVTVDPMGKEFWEVNNPEDIPLIENLLGGVS